MSNKKSVDLLDLATIFARRKKIILWSLVIATILGLVTALLWPKTYKSELTYIVTDSNSINFSSGGLLSGLANLSVSGSNISADQTLIILRGKDLKDQVIEEFNLSEVYDIEIQEYLREALDNQLEIEEFREGGLGFNNIQAVSLAIKDKEPERAYEMIQFYFDKLDSTVTHLNRKIVEGGYLMLQNRLEQNKKDLEVAEDSLVSFQKRHGILEVEEQAKALVENIASVKSELVKLEVEIGFVEEVFGENSSKASELNAQKEALQEKYNEMMVAEEDAENEFDIYKSMSEMPDLFAEYLRRYREVQVQQEIYKVLYPQYEQQKLNYEEVNSGLRIIDSANLPTYKDSPKRAYIVLGFMFFGLILAILIILFSEWKRSIEENQHEQYERYQKFLRALKFGNAKN